MGKTPGRSVGAAALRMRGGAAILCPMARLLAATLRFDDRLVREVLARHLFTPTSGRETGYLLAGLLTGTAGFTIVVIAFSLALAFGILIIGLPVAVLAAAVDRRWCSLERRRAAVVLGRAIPEPYPAIRTGGWLARRLAVLSDRQTWLDGLWMFISLPVGAAGFVVAALAWVGLPALLAAPVYVWAIPGWVHANDVAISILAPLLAAPAAVLGAWLLHPTALAVAGLAELMLGPSRREQLERRVQTLSETRAGAVDAAVTELQRVERDLHDGAQARLVALAMDLGLAEQRLAQEDAETAREHVASAREQARAAMTELRELVRGIGPSILQDHGLDAALTALVSGRHPPVELRVDLPPAPAGPRETAAYFVVAEALANARKHSGASRVSVRAWEDAARRLVVEVVDDGRGGASLDAGSGLSGLRKRVAALDGQLIVSSPAGGPTTVRAELPGGAGLPAGGELPG